MYTRGTYQLSLSIYYAISAMRGVSTGIDFFESSIHVTTHFT